MTHSLGAAGARELAVLTRSGMIESRHLGAAVVISPGGTVQREIGDGAALIYPRSSLKPLQAIAVLRSGVALDGVHAVIAASSHSGTPEHVRIVREVLTRAGSTEADLQCPLDWPLDTHAALELRTAGLPRSRVTMNCSGKHAAFLLACAENGWPISSYLDPAHPLQQLIRQTVTDFTGEAIIHTGVDGCGAPVFAVSVRGLAAAIGRVSRAVARPGEDADAAGLATAILSHPWVIDGHGRPNTVVIERLGLIAKGGAEGVLVMGTPDGTAVALKILDGSQRAATLVALQLLAAAGVIDRSAAEQVIEETTDKVLGGGIPVGSIELSAEIAGGH